MLDQWMTYPALADRLLGLPSGVLIVERGRSGVKGVTRRVPHLDRRTVRRPPTRTGPGDAARASSTWPSGRRDIYDRKIPDKLYGPKEYERVPAILGRTDLDQYAARGEEELEVKALSSGAYADMDTVGQISERFGGVGELHGALDELNALVYEAA